MHHSSSVTTGDSSEKGRAFAFREECHSPSRVDTLTTNVHSRYQRPQPVFFIKSLHQDPKGLNFTEPMWRLRPWRSSSGPRGGAVSLEHSGGNGRRRQAGKAAASQRALRALMSHPFNPPSHSYDHLTNWEDVDVEDSQPGSSAAAISDISLV